MKKLPKQPTWRKYWSICIRLGHVEYQDGRPTQYCKCVTCGAVRHWKEMDAGHFIPSSRSPLVKWDLRNGGPQCSQCNMNMNDPRLVYRFARWIDDVHGKGTSDELIDLSSQPYVYRPISEKCEQFETLKETARKLLKERT